MPLQTLSLSHTHSSKECVLVHNSSELLKHFLQHHVLICRVTRTSCDAPPKPQRVSGSDDVNCVFRVEVGGGDGAAESAVDDRANGLLELKRVVIREDNINSRGGSRRAGSRPVRRCSHPGPTKTRAKEGGASWTGG